MRSIRQFIAAGALLAASCSAGAFSLVPGDIYTSNEGSLTIYHYDHNGSLLESDTLSSSYGTEVRGMAFGPQGWLYAVTTTPQGMGVYALDGDGVMRESYASDAYLAGGSFYGKIAFGSNGLFYVAGHDRLMAFTPGAATPAAIYTNNQISDVAALPSGNLLVLSAYQLDEITPQGQVVRSIAPDNAMLVNAHGVVYDPVTNDIFVSMLGYTGNPNQILRMDGVTGHVKGGASFSYADDLLLTDDRRLIASSSLFATTIFDVDLNPVGVLAGSSHGFLAQMPIPEPNAAALLLLGLPVLAWRRRISARHN